MLNVAVLALIACRFARTRSRLHKVVLALSNLITPRCTLITYVQDR